MITNHPHPKNQLLDTVDSSTNQQFSMHRIVSVASAGKGRNSIRLRWRFNKKRYSLCMLNTIENIPNASLLALQIEADIRTNQFDPTLNKYRDIKKAPVDILDKFEHWCTHIRNIEMHRSTDYLCTYRMLERWGSFDIDNVAALLGKEPLAASTYNRRLMYLHTFFEWMIKYNHIKSNPLADVPRRKKPGKRMWIENRRSPITTQDINRILSAIHTNEFCHPSSAYLHSCYYPFLYFVFTTGVRNAEAIGLRCRSVFTEYVEISEVMARTVDGTHAAARIRKETKTAEIRRIPLTEELRAILKSVTQGKAPDDLVFQSPKGNPIDDRMLQRRVLKPVLEKLNISPRDLYAARHSFGTRAINQGMAPNEVAYLMGHGSVETTFRNYVSPSIPKSLPIMF